MSSHANGSRSAMKAEVRSAVFDVLTQRREPISPLALFEELKAKTQYDHNQTLEIVRTMIEKGELRLTDNSNIELGQEHIAA